ncbi:MAG: SEC-C metal-binding domain-containing protein [Gaiellales bacterium]
MQGLIDSGWAAWLPLELMDALEAAGGNAAARRAFTRRLAEGPGPAERERWDRFALVCPSRIDLPVSADGLTAVECYRILEELGLAAGDPPRPVDHAEPVELVLTLDHDQVRELEQTRRARDPGAPAETPVDALPSIERTFGQGVGRNDPCPCGSGKKFKRCHGR